MSTDRQRVKRAIQRIAVQAPELRSLLEAAESKGGKPKSAGVGGGAGSAGGNDAQETRICCDGSVSDDGNPGVEERDPQDGDQAGLDATDPANLSGLDGGCLTGVTDCDTGDAICFCGDDWLPPDGWDGPTDPPEDDTWREGFYVTWSISVSSAVRASGSGPSTGSEEAAFRAAMETYCLEENLANTTISPCTSGGTITSGFAGTGACLPGDSGENRNYSYSFSCNTCSGQPECDYTAEDPPLVESWPEDSCTNLAIKGGKIVGSKYDPENDGSWSAPRGEIHLCDGANDMYLKPSDNGGWKTIDSTKTSGYLYSKNFELVAHIDGNEYSDPAI